MALSQSTLIENGNAVRLDWSDGTSVRFHAIWLRDNALDETTRSLANGQRLLTVNEISPNLALAACQVSDTGDLDVRFAPDDHTTTFPSDWLKTRIYDDAPSRRDGWTASDIALWDRAYGSDLPTTSYTVAKSRPDVLADWLRTIETHGFAVMHDCPAEDGALLDVTALFGYVRETNYGKLFNVRAEVNPNNLAYSNLGLQAHTDNPYRDPVPTLQVLACIENTVEGGESAVVDGFHVARRLQEENSRWFDLLAKHPARFTYAGSSGVCLEAKRPMIDLGPDGELVGIRFNNRSAAPFTDVPYDDMAEFYAAYRRFAELVDDPEMAVTFRLEAGQLFIVDNTRVLHARTAFSGTGERWLQGCYADKDGLISTRKSLDAQLSEVAA